MKNRSNISFSQILEHSKLSKIKFYSIKKNKFFVCNNKFNNLKYLVIPGNTYIYKKNDFIKLLTFRKEIQSKNFFFYKIINWMKNLNKKHRKFLKLKGLGLKITLSDDKKLLTLKLGFSHLVNIKIPNKLKINIKKNRIALISDNLAFLSNFAKKIKHLKKYNNYNGRGFSYKREIKKYKTFKKK
jgi:ribosomal protein L6P/L9E